MNFLFYPVFEDEKMLADHYFRLHWYVYPFRDKISSITIVHTLDLNDVGVVPDYLDPQLETLKGQIPSINLIRITSDGQLEELIKAADVILLARVDQAQPDKIPASPLKSLIKKKRILRIDHNSERFAGSFYLGLFEMFPDKRNDAIDASRKVFDRIKKRCINKKGYIFGTGPGLAMLDRYDFSDGISIACNSMVRNQELLDRLRPPLIVMADPIFHAGPSKYAAVFRKELISALDRYNSDLIVPLRDYHIYKTYLPERFHDRIAAIPFKRGSSPNLDLSRNYFVTTTANILTLFLIPLACTFFKEIAIAGCDGRPLEDSSYFWKHDRASQFNEEMQSIRDAHPAFFDIDYNDYYLEHCTTVEAWLDFAEKNKKKVISVITPSFIPALRRRFKDPLAKTGVPAEIIMLDPDALDHFGHYLALDDRLHEACLIRGLEFTVLGHVNCASDVIDERPFFQPVFSVHSWTIGNRPKGPAISDIDKFENELRRALTLRKEKGLTRKTVIYMYCGSLPVAQVVERVLSEFDNVYAVICLFWLSFVDYKSRSYVDKWGGFIKRIKDDKKISITVPTKRLAMGVAEAFGVELPVVPHPSTTFSDRDCAQLFQNTNDNRSCRVSKKMKILFPGGMRQEKGFPITVETALSLERDYPDRIHCIVRAYETKSTPQSMGVLAKKLIDGNISVISQYINNEEFHQFLAQGDIIVLPYQAPDFTERTSGLLIDAIYLGIPVVVWENTWLADIVDEYGNGIVVSGSHHKACYDAILKAIDQYDSLSLAARKARVSYFNSNNWGALVSSIINANSAATLNGCDEVNFKAGGMCRNTAITFSRENKASLDETNLIFQLFRNYLNGSLMIDVGAHHGSALSSFKRMGWKIYAFEPDPKNRSYLEKHYGTYENVIIDPRAVGEKVEKAKPFYASDESTGISGMLAFRNTHKQVATVEVTTIEKIINKYNIDHIDFLKIDVEGYDFGVLKGVPWDKIKPDVIECEFEDEKTKLLGHTWRDICDYLIDRGYTVYVSEWHPIIRYGIRHDWYGLKKYPCELYDEKAWGNLLAFKTDPGWEAINTALRKVLKVEKPETVVDLATPAPSEQNIRTANKLFRKGKYMQAVSIYITLYEKYGLSMYANNAMMAAKKLKIPNIENVEDLRRYMEK